MDDLIKNLMAKLNVSEAQAKDAIDTVMGFVKDKFPDIGGKLDGIVSRVDKDGDGLDVGDIKDAVGGMFGKKEE